MVYLAHRSEDIIKVIYGDGEKRHFWFSGTYFVYSRKFYTSVLNNNNLCRYFTLTLHSIVSNLVIKLFL